MMKSTAIGSLLMLGLAFGFVGCEETTGDFLGDIDRNELTPNTVAPDYFMNESNLTIQDARLIGTMGNVDDIDTQASRISGNTWNDSSYVQLDVDNSRNGAAMAVLNTDFDFATIEPGVYSSQNRMISVLGCSGNSPGAWDFDETTDDVEVIVEEDAEIPELMHVQFVATFAQGRETTPFGDIAIEPSIVTGAFTVDNTVR